MSPYHGDADELRDKLRALCVVVVVQGGDGDTGFGVSMSDAVEPAKFAPEMVQRLRAMADHLEALVTKP